MQVFKCSLEFSKVQRRKFKFASMHCWQFSFQNHFFTKSFCFSTSQIVSTLFHVNLFFILFNFLFHFFDETVGSLKYVAHNFFLKYSSGIQEASLCVSIKVIMFFF